MSKIINLISNNYEIFKTLHIVSVMSWMAGMLYLPRIFVYHCRVKYGSEADGLFRIMEYKLMKYIMNPTMILTIIFGLLNAYVYGFKALGIWFHIKMLCVLLLVIAHGFFSRWRKAFARGENIHSETFYRVLNEVPAVLMVIAVSMVVIKPFD